ncbi:TonB-dependent receptor [Niabella beijingensis]|uniref:TonB-dependent receptor n=1 Tax=Niabella beijingensis TaxID=2872700 RepID=UPI001CBE5627|nr:TonB-dependent receptor [Niabella beijingensis]MBZ4189102.1 TonB-dependent receptor [Niabella beijingensis]
MKAAVLLTLLFVCISGKTQQLLPSSDTLPVVDSAGILNAGDRDELPVVLIDDTGEDNNAPVSPVLSAGRDPYLAAVAFNFSPLRFRLRGYNNGDAVYLNNADFTGPDNGRIPFGLWSGLTNMMRVRQQVYGPGVTDFAPGRPGLNTNTDMRAGVQPVQTMAGYALSNRNYRHRLLLTHSSGFNKKGWAYSFMGSVRYAAEGYVPGTYYRSASYYAAADRRIGSRQLLSLITFGAPTESGRQTASVQEAMDLAGSNFYNPAWGYQNGRKRNAAIAETVQPVIMAVHEYQPGITSNWITTLAYSSGKQRLSGFDWYNAPDPRPDYYRYLPGYYAATQPDRASDLRQLLHNDPDRLQINWHRLYEVNRNNKVVIPDAEGIPGNDAEGRRSLYILSNRVNRQQRIITSSVYRTTISGRITVTAGGSFQKQSSEYYQEVKDLLGGDFWLNVNQFAERDFPLNRDAAQYDLDHPNQLKREGDQYGYHYQLLLHRFGAWTQVLLSLNRFEFFFTGGLNYEQFYRKGYNRNGLFPAASYGPSKRLQFATPTLKAGLTYKYNGRNYFFINGGYYKTPPLFDNVFISPRTRNTLQSGAIRTETTQSFEAGYKWNSPRIKLSVTGYYTTIDGAYDVMTFYHDQYRNFVNYALSGLGTVHFGGEAGADIKLTSTWSLNAAIATGRYYYNSRPNAVVTVDNSAAVLAEQVVYMKNFRVPGTPQDAYSAGLFYRSPRYWFVSLTGNYFNHSWLSINPIRRTAEATGDADPSSPETEGSLSRMTAQEQLPAQVTLDLFCGWTKRLHGSHPRRRQAYLVFNIGINNLLNTQTMRSGGFEQLRFDAESRDVDRFPPKYYYAYGLNYYASVMVRMK